MANKEYPISTIVGVWLGVNIDKYFNIITFKNYYIFIFQKNINENYFNLYYDYKYKTSNLEYLIYNTLNNFKIKENYSNCDIVFFNESDNSDYNFILFNLANKINPNELNKFVNNSKVKISPYTGSNDDSNYIFENRKLLKIEDEYFIQY